METTKTIERFAGEYHFLSNFAHTPMCFRGHYFQNAEAAFQSQKCPERASQFESLTPSQAKHLGRQVSIRPDWNDVRNQVMYTVVYEKFAQNPRERQQLMETGSAILVEGNTWNDRYWGVCNGKGENHLGIILMRVRETLITGRFRLLGRDTAYQQGRDAAQEAIGLAKSMMYDLPIVRHISSPDTDVIHGLSDAFAQAGVVRFVWMPCFGYDQMYEQISMTKHMALLKREHWRVADIAIAPIPGIGGESELFVEGFLMEKF